MGDWPAVGPYNGVTITPGAAESIGAELAGHLRSASTTGSTWPTSNRAIFVPFCVYSPITIVKGFWENYNAVSGNVDVGVYDDQGTRLTAIGSTAQTTINVTQSVDFADVDLLPGIYYLAMAMDNTTGALLCSLPGTVAARSMGILSQSSAFPLPATATFAAAQDSYIPYFGVTTRTVV